MIETSPPRRVVDSALEVSPCRWASGPVILPLTAWRQLAEWLAPHRQFAVTHGGETCSDVSNQVSPPAPIPSGMCFAAAADVPVAGLARVGSQASARKS